MLQTKTKVVDLYYAFGSTRNRFKPRRMTNMVEQQKSQNNLDSISKFVFSFEKTPEITLFSLDRRQIPITYSLNQSLF